MKEKIKKSLDFSNPCGINRAAYKNIGETKMRVYKPITSIGYQFFNTSGDSKNSEKIDSRDFFEEEQNQIVRK